MNFLGKMVVGFFGSIAFIIFVCLFLVLPIYYLWNWLMPIIFGLPEITLWQALGINLLSSLLFGHTSYK